MRAKEREKERRNNHMKRKKTCRNYRKFEKIKKKKTCEVDGKSTKKMKFSIKSFGTGAENIEHVGGVEKKNSHQ